MADGDADGGILMRGDKIGRQREICILGMNYPPEPTGIAPYTGGLAQQLARAGYHVVAHVAHPHYPSWQIHQGFGGWRRSELRNGVTVQRRLHYVPQPPRGLKRLLSELSFGLRIALAKLGSPGVVVAVSPPLFSIALAVLRLRMTPRRPRLIVWVQDVYSLGILETQEGGAWVQRITRWVERATLLAADRVVVIHPKFAHLLVQELGVTETKVEVVRNWTHLRPFAAVEPAVARARLGWLPSGATLAVHTGNMGVKQGLENIVEAARIADQRGESVYFILVGDGGERRRLERCASGIAKLSFIDPLCDEDYRLVLAAADVLLVNEKPGVSEMALPSKLTAYFDAGRPVVAATDPAGITASEISTADAGVVVPAGDPEALLGAVLALRESADLAARYSANGRRYRATALDEKAAIVRWLAIISEEAAQC